MSKFPISTLKIYICYISFFLSLDLFLLAHCRNGVLFLHLITHNDKNTPLDSSGRGIGQRKDISLTTQAFMTPVGFKTTNPGIKWLYTHALDLQPTGNFIVF
jgi:hypothetical protein